MKKGALATGTASSGGRGTHAVDKGLQDVLGAIKTAPKGEPKTKTRRG